MFTQTLESNRLVQFLKCAQRRRFFSWSYGLFESVKLGRPAPPPCTVTTCCSGGNWTVSNLWPHSPHWKTNGTSLTDCVASGPGDWPHFREQGFATVSRVPSTGLITDCTSQQQ